MEITTIIDLKISDLYVQIVILKPIRLVQKDLNKKISVLIVVLQLRLDHKDAFHVRLNILDKIVLLNQ